MTTAVRVEPVLIGPEGWPDADSTLGWHVIDWCEEWLEQPDGPNAGESWAFTEEQARFVTWFYAIDSDGRFTYRTATLRRMKGWGKDPMAAVLAAVEFVGPCRYSGERGEGGIALGQQHPASWVQIAAVSRDQTRNTMTLFPGLLSKKLQEEHSIDLGKEIIYANHGRRRLEAVTSSPRALEGGRSTFVVLNEALALDTPLPTPDGWTTVGDVSAGDMIYGSSGPVRVIKATPVYLERPCFRVTFADGTSLVVDEGHLWQTRVVASAALPRVRTTREMVDDGRRFAVPLVEPLESPDQPLPLDPYVLGYWLGDGDSRSAIVSVGREDTGHVVSAMAGRGVVARVGTGTGTPAVSLTIPGSRRNRNDPRPLGVRGRLAALGVLRNKHIPSMYLRGSREQRLQLLRGLMDSDGCCTTKSEAIFVQTSRRLAEQTLELIRSLGYRAALTTTRDERYVPALLGYRIAFRADEAINPFDMARKASRVIGHRRAWKSITSIEPVETVPVRCIEVDSDDHLFVAGEGWTLTHNTQHWLKPNEGHAMAETIARNVGKSRDGSARTLAITNAHLVGEDSVAEHDWLAYQQAIKKGATDILYDSRESPDDFQLEDHDALVAGLEAARGDSTWLDVKRLAAEVQDPRTSKSLARRFYLNQIRSERDPWISEADWRACATNFVVEDGDAIVLGFDGSRFRDATAIVATHVESGYQWPLNVWARPELAPEGWEVPAEEVTATIAEAFERWRVWRCYADPYYWEDTIASWAGRWGDDKVIYFHTAGGRISQVARAVKAFENAIRARELLHVPDPLFAQHVANCTKHEIGIRDDDGEPLYTIQKDGKGSPRKIDIAMAAVLSWQARNDALKAGVANRPPVPHVFVFGDNDA